MLNALHTSFLRNRLVRLAGGQSLLDMVRTCTTEHDNVQQRIRTKTVGTVYGHTSSLTRGVQSRNDLVLAILVDGQYLARVLRRDTTHCNSVRKGLQVEGRTYCCNARLAGRGWAPS